MGRFLPCLGATGGVASAIDFGGPTVPVTGDKVVAAEWDFEGPKTPYGRPFEILDRLGVRAERRHVCARIQDLGRVRVVVK